MPSLAFRFFFELSNFVTIIEFLDVDLLDLEFDAAKLDNVLLLQHKLGLVLSIRHVAHYQIGLFIHLKGWMVLGPAVLIVVHGIHILLHVLLLLSVTHLLHLVAVHVLDLVKVSHFIYP